MKKSTILCSLALFFSLVGFWVIKYRTRESNITANRELVSVNAENASTLNRDAQTFSSTLIRLAQSRRAGSVTPDFSDRSSRKGDESQTETDPSSPSVDPSSMEPTKFVALMDLANHNEDEFLRKSLLLGEDDLAELGAIRTNFEKRILESRRRGGSADDVAHLFSELDSGFQEVMGVEKLKLYQAFKDDQLDAIQQQIARN